MWIGWIFVESQPCMTLLHRPLGMTHFVKEIKGFPIKSPLQQMLILRVESYVKQDWLY